jgi:hypothetical protein
MKYTHSNRFEVSGRYRRKYISLCDLTDMASVLLALTADGERLKVSPKTPTSSTSI